MATGSLPDAGQIINSLINSILLVDDDLVIHYASPSAQQLLAQSSRKLFGTLLPDLTGYFSLNIEVMHESLDADQGFTDSEVTLIVDGSAHVMALTAQRLPDGFILLEMAPIDKQCRLSQEQRAASACAAGCGARYGARDSLTRLKIRWAACAAAVARVA